MHIHWKPFYNRFHHKDLTNQDPIETKPDQTIVNPAVSSIFESKKDDLSKLSLVNEMTQPKKRSFIRKIFHFSIKKKKASEENPENLFLENGEKNPSTELIPLAQNAVAKEASETSDPLTDFGSDSEDIPEKDESKKVESEKKEEIEVVASLTEEEIKRKKHLEFLERMQKLSENKPACLPKDIYSLDIHLEASLPQKKQTKYQKLNNRDSYSDQMDEEKITIMKKISRFFKNFSCSR